MEARPAELAERAASDYLTEDGNMEKMELECELERLQREDEDHDSRYRQVRAKGIAHSAA